MFERFTDRARRLVVLAQEEARRLDHNYIGTEHILLGLLHEGEGIGAQALQSLGIELTAVRRRVEDTIGRGPTGPADGHIPFTPRAKKVLEMSLREALGLGHNYIGTEHILLGLVREGEGVAAQVLRSMGASLEAVRARVTELLQGVAVTATVRTEPLGEPPQCPKCATSLTVSLGYKTVEATTYDAGDDARQVVVVFCKLCGTALGTAG